MEAHISAFLASLATQEEYSESTRLAYASDLRVFFKHLTTTLQRAPSIEDINAEQVIHFLDSERLIGWRQSTLIRRRATLRRFVAYLKVDGSLQENLFEVQGQDIQQVIASVPTSPTPICLSNADVGRLWKVIETSPRPRARRDQALLALLLETGLSVGALVDLNIEDIELRAWKIHLRLDNGQDLWLPLGDASEPIDRYLRQGRPELCNTAEENALFVSQMGGRLSRQGVWQILRHWGQRLDPPLELSPRLVRHTAAIRMARCGKSIPEIHALLGHTNLLSTQALIRRLKTACVEMD